MNTNTLAAAVALSDQDLLTRIDALAAKERQTSAELVAHLAALELRPSLYAAKGYGSLFAYCTQALRLSEDAACNRIDAARVCRQFPMVLELLAAGRMSLAAVRLLKPHLTEESHRAILARAENMSRKEIERLIADLAPQPDVVASVRKLPSPESIQPSLPESDFSMAQATLLSGSTSAEREGGGGMAIGPGGSTTTSPAASVPSPAILPPTATGLRSSRPIVRASAPQRYRVQFTIDEQTHEKLRRVQALLRREIPNGDPGLIFGQALDLLLEKVEEAKLGAPARPRPRRFIRRGTDRSAGSPKRDGAGGGNGSRHVPTEVKRTVWRRDAGQCAFVAPDGRRCTEGTFLEFHHIQPYAMRGPATVANISLRCRRHNQYEGEVIFGPLSPRP